MFLPDVPFLEIIVRGSVMYLALFIMLRIVLIPSLEDLNGDNALSVRSRISRRWTRIDLAQIVEKIYVPWRPSPMTPNVRFGS